ncbi:MAG: Rieske 2Fe-2S domain-containing protein, partial [Chloroflexi bacterium]|nr:Rieske 2Fe-2S domain-containing protein [Chloroflexota bacterium]
KGRDLTETIEQSLANASALKSLAHGLRALLNRVFFDTPLRSVKNFLNGTWLEHPLHPTLTDVPIGAWTAHVGLDLLSLVFGVRKLGKASAFAGLIGTFGAVSSIITGLMDYMDIDPPDQVVALVHGLTNIFATTLFAASFLLRRGNRWRISPQAATLSLLGYTVVTVGGYLGGSLVFRRGVMVNRNAFRTEPKEFARVMALDDLAENRPIRVEVKGNPVMLLRRGDNVIALGAVCSHLGGPLDEGKIENDQVECPWHGSRFALRDGSLCAGPATAPVPSYETRVLNGQVQIKMRD